MIIPIRCPTCGKVVADKYEYYLSELKRSAESTQREKAVFGFDEHAGKVLDDLKLDRYCCRRTMLGQPDGNLVGPARQRYKAKKGVRSAATTTAKKTED
jgi:DNA-directed RNA polymerase subunit N